MRYLLLLLVILAGCGQPGPKRGESAAVDTIIPPVQRTATDSDRNSVARAIALDLTRRYSYDIYARVQQVTYDTLGRTAPGLYFYCDWFDKQNAAEVFNLVRDLCRTHGFKFVTFSHNPRTSDATFSVATYDVD